MKLTSTGRRSVSPFGTKPVEKDYFDLFKEEIDGRCPHLIPTESKKLELFQDIGRLPETLREIYHAPSNDGPQLGPLCDYLLNQNLPIIAAGISDSIFNAMQHVFDHKTELFMVDHHDKDHCAKMGWKEEYRDMVLFSEERNLLVGRYFDPATKDNPGRFSEFINSWSQTENLDRLLHFLDFCANLTRLSFDFYLLGTHPAVTRLTRNKENLRQLISKCSPLIKKIKSPTWEKDFRRTFL